VSYERPGLRRTFAALQYREFRLLILATIAAQFGDQVQTVANLWQVYALTGSAVHLGFTGLARAVPVILFSLVGGVIADRVDRKKIIVFTQVTNGLSALILAALSATGQIEVWHIYAATFLSATLTSASAPARRAVIATLVPRRHMMNAMAMNASVNQLDRVVAPAIAGVLIAAFGLPLTYGINASAHVITAAALGFVSLGTMPERLLRSPLHDLLDGLSFIRVRTIIPALLAFDVIAMLFGSFRVLLPIIADHFDAGPAGYGLLAAAPAVGSFLGTAAIMYLGDFPYKGRVIIGAILAYCGALVALGLAPWFPMALVATAALGLTDSTQAQTRNAAIQLMTPDELRGRVSSFQHMIQAGGPALGQGIMGAAAFAAGTPLALVVGGVICAVITIGILAAREDVRARDLEDIGEPVPVGPVRPLSPNFPLPILDEEIGSEGRSPLPHSGAAGESGVRR
jgi:MFS family permease